MNRTPVLYLGDLVNVRVNDFAGHGTVEALDVKTEGACKPMVLVRAGDRLIRAYYDEVRRVDTWPR